MDYLMLLGASLLQTGSLVASKVYQQKAGASPNRAFIFIMATDVAVIFIMFALNGFTFHTNATALILGAAATLTALVGSVLGFRAIKTASIAFYSFFLMSGGMIVPYVYGLVFWNEPLTPWRIGGVLIILLALFLSGKESFGTCGLKAVLLCVAVFFLNGAVNVISKYHQIHPQAVAAPEFSMVCSAIRVVAIACILPFFRPEKDDVKPFPKKLLLVAVVNAAFGGISYLLQLLSAATLPATVCYPMLTGGSMILATLSGAIAFKEKITKRTALCLILCFLGTLMFL